MTQRFPSIVVAVLACAALIFGCHSCKWLETETDPVLIQLDAGEWDPPALDVFEAAAAHGLDVAAAREVIARGGLQPVTAFQPVLGALRAIQAADDLPDDQGGLELPIQQRLWVDIREDELQNYLEVGLPE